MYWLSMKPPSQGGGGEPTGLLAIAISLQYGSFERFKEHFINEAVSHFGSGWAWITQVIRDLQLASSGFHRSNRVQDSNGMIRVETTHDAGAPSHSPLLVCDLWEHAYYVDYRNRRKEFVEVDIGLLK